MRYSKRIVFFLLLVSMFSCKKYIAKLINKPSDEVHTPTQSKDYITENKDVQSDDLTSNLRNNIVDGVYTAEVRYKNEKSLNEFLVTQVVVNDGYVTELKWINGAWLTSGYFKPGKINESGECELYNIADNFRSSVKVLNLKQKSSNK
jgi:hypothetical protein